MSHTIWQQCLLHLEESLTNQQFNTWIRPLNATLEGKQLTVLAPNKFVKDWVQQRFSTHITDYLQRRHGDQHLDVDFQIAGDNTLVKPKESYPEKENSQFRPRLSTGENKIEAPSIVTKSRTMKDRRREDRIQINKNSSLRKDYTFENFVEGKSNQMARAVAAQVADNPGGSYNPLYIYGGVGLGKTHLMHAIGNAIVAQNPQLRAAYLHSEKFVQDMVKALQQNAINRFKAHYRSLNVLLIDDIQFFEGKERSQEEFFHTFNALLEGHQQVVLTCDRYPKEVEGLEERLKSRFGWGMTVAVEPPELETRVAILLSKAKQADVHVPDDVAFFIAKKIRSNIRELEGALKRVVAHARFKGCDVSVEFAQEALKDMLALHAKTITIENIQKRVSEYYKIRHNDLLSKNRSRSIARPRQLAMSLAKELTSHSLPEIGSAFGGRDHTTVLHAHRKIRELRQSDNKIEEDYNNLLRILNT